MAAGDEAFAPIGVTWTRVSPELTKARWLVWSMLALIVLVGWVLVSLFAGAPTWVNVVGFAVIVLGYPWGLWYFARRTKSWGYAQRDDDLIVTRGFMFRRLVIVPYGRMQLVDVTAGPVERTLGIARLKLHTAAATTDAAIPGLTPDIASSLRDQLARLAEERAAGL